MLIYALLSSKSRESHTHFCCRIHKCAISLLLVKMSRVAFLLTFVVVCQDLGVVGGVKLILAMPVFWHHFLTPQSTLPYVSP